MSLPRLQTTLSFDIFSILFPKMALQTFYHFSSLPWFNHEFRIPTPPKPTDATPQNNAARYHKWVNNDFTIWHIIIVYLDYNTSQTADFTKPSNQFNKPSAFALLLLHHSVAATVNTTTTLDFHHHRAQSQSLPCFNTNTDVAADHQAQQPPPAISLWALIIDVGVALSRLKSKEDLMVVQWKRGERRKW